MSFEGKRIGKYVLKDKLGQGGMGIVFLAVQEGLNREVALKVLPEKNVERSQDLLKRFMKEASVCAKLSHPNIIKVFDYGFEENVYYYAMEVLRATSLEDLLKKQPMQPLDFTLRIAREMTSAFEYYHPMSIVHRDIKPANIMLDTSGKSILTDFGLVKDLLSEGITREGAAVGTPYYMAPEQVKGQAVDGGTDIWQLGVVLYRMLTGRMPFKGEGGVDVLRLILTAETPPPTTYNPKLSPGLENLLMNCLEKDRALRYRTAQELAADLAIASRRGSVARRRDSAGSLGAPFASLPATERARSTPGIPRASTTVALPIQAPPTAWPPWLGPSTRVTALVLMIPAAFGIAWMRGRRLPYTAADVQTRAGVRRAVVEWQSPSEYAGKVEWGAAGGDGELRTAAGTEPASQRHTVSLSPTEAGKEYRYCIVFPDGRRSLEYTFRAPESPLTGEDLQLEGGALQLAFSTPAAAAARLASAAESASDPSPETHHRLRLERVDPARAPLELTFKDAAGDEVHLEREELLALLRRDLLPKLLPELAKGLEGYDLEPFVKKQIDQRLPAAVCNGAIASIQAVGLDGLLKGQTGAKPHYGHFKPGDAGAVPLADAVRSHVEALPFLGVLRRFLAIGRGVFDERRLSPEQTSRLLAQLGKLRDLDYYAAFLGIPFTLGMEALFIEDFRVRFEPAIAKPAGTLEEVIPVTPIWGHPYKEYLFAERTGIDKRNYKMKGHHDWRPVLSAPDRWKRVELALLDAKLEPELLYRVTVNHSLVLVFRNDPETHLRDRTEQYPSMSMTFDPRFLKPGENLIHVEISETPGSRYLGLKANNLRALKLAWE